MWSGRDRSMGMELGLRRGFFLRGVSACSVVGRERTAREGEGGVVECAEGEAGGGVSCRSSI